MCLFEIILTKNEYVTMIFIYNKTPKNQQSLAELRSDFLSDLHVWDFWFEVSQVDGLEVASMGSVLELPWNANG